MLCRKLCIKSHRQYAHIISLGFLDPAGADPEKNLRGAQFLVGLVPCPNVLLVPRPSKFMSIRISFRHSNSKDCQFLFFQKIDLQLKQLFSSGNVLFERKPMH